MRNPEFKVFVVDDEPAIRKLLTTGFETQNFKVICSGTLKDARARYDLENPDLVILDLGLPDGAGVDLLRELRNRGDRTPMIILSSRADEAGIVEALDLGADDYVVKPFGISELIARMRAALRHRLQEQGTEPVFKLHDLSVDLVRRIVRVKDEEVKLSPKEYEILRLMVQHAGKVLTHRYILNQVWGDYADVQYLRVFIRQLRSKLRDDLDNPRYIFTETGVGYRLREPDQRVAEVRS